MNELDSKFKKILLILSTIIGMFFLMTVGVLYFHASGMMSSNGESSVSEGSRPEQERPTPDEGSDVTTEPEVYELRMNATEYQIELFEELIPAHNQFEALGTDEALQDYASAIVKNFVADFFTLSNKESRSDIGGVQFFSDDVVDHFTADAMDNFYLYLGRHIEAFGSEAMPEIASVAVTGVEFGQRPVEVEEEEPDEEINIWEIIDPEEPEDVEYERTIIVYVEWTFAPTALPQIDEFQTSARFVLMEVEDAGVRIFQIQLIEEECEMDIWGQCIVEPDDAIYGYEETEGDTYPPATH